MLGANAVMRQCEGETVEAEGAAPLRVVYRRMKKHGYRAKVMVLAMAM